MYNVQCTEKLSNCSICTILTLLSGGEQNERCIGAASRPNSSKSGRVKCGDETADIPAQIPGIDAVKNEPAGDGGHHHEAPLLATS